MFAFTVLLHGGLKHVRLFWGVLFRLGLVHIYLHILVFLCISNLQDFFAVVWLSGELLLMKTKTIILLQSISGSAL